MYSDMAVDYFGHNAVYGTTARRYQAHNLPAACLCVERPFQCIDLTAKAADAIEKLLFLFDGVLHLIPRALYEGIVVRYPQEYICASRAVERFRLNPTALGQLQIGFGLYQPRMGLA